AESAAWPVNLWGRAYQNLLHLPPRQLVEGGQLPVWGPPSGYPALPAPGRGGGRVGRRPRWLGWRPSGRIRWPSEVGQPAQQRSRLSRTARPPAIYRSVQRPAPPTESRHGAGPGLP